MAASQASPLHLSTSSRNPCPSYQSRPDWLLSSAQQSTAVPLSPRSPDLALPPLLDNEHHSQDITRPALLLHSQAGISANSQDIGSILQKFSIDNGDREPKTATRTHSIYAMRNGRISKHHAYDGRSFRRSSTSSSSACSASGSDTTLRPEQHIQRRKKADKERHNRKDLGAYFKKIEQILEELGRGSKMRTKLNKNNSKHSGGLKNKKVEILSVALGTLSEQKEALEQNAQLLDERDAHIERLQNELRTRTVKTEDKASGCTMPFHIKQSPQPRL